MGCFKIHINKVETSLLKIYPEGKSSLCVVYRRGVSEPKLYRTFNECGYSFTAPITLESIHHGQGIFKRLGTGTFRNEYVIKDHLGNTRIIYADINGNGSIASTEILDENHYYAYGMELPGTWTNASGTNYNYKFNGIERIEAYNLDFATYRGMDPILGIWYQVDPKAEAMMGMSPYCAMGNNPVLHTDPNGDILPAIAIAAIVGGVVGAGGNIYAQWKNGNLKTTGDWFKAGIIGGAAGAIGAATGTYAVMGSAALATTAGAAATGASIGGYTLGTTGFVSGAISGTVSGAISSPFRQIGNMLAGWQDEFSYKEWGTETLLGGAIGGTVGGVSAWAKGQNFWWGNSVKIVPTSPFGSVHPELPQRVIDPASISELASDANINSGQGHIYANRVKEYFDLMSNNSFDALKHSKEIGGFIHNGKYIVTWGNHRVVASLAYGMKTNDFSILTTLMNGGGFKIGNPADYGYLNQLFSTKWR
ncbi:MAG: hypothetical protein RLZZ546_2746 [Bacteroidota bacterium]|jgi:RHS repeat-associated protein